LVFAQDNTDEATTDEVVPEEVPDFSNSTNMLGYTFRDYTEMESDRINWNAFMTGANSTWYAPNSTLCYNHAVNLIYYDIDMFVIKLMYGNFKDNMLNTTLTLRNVSDVSYVCLDAAENLYVYAMYKFKLFSYDWTNLLLGTL
jgi:hypothetical protein